MNSKREQLKLHALSQTLFPPVSLPEAVQKLKFIQIDPIKSPAPAQDLIIRHRVTDYHVGDLERHSITLDMEEDFLYAHGYLTRDLWQLMHPRPKVKERLTKLDKQVLATIRNLPEIHPKDLSKYFESKRVTNWWGGYSQAAKMSLDRLHYFGHIRVLRREKGIRVYQAFTPPESELTPDQRLSTLIMAVISIHAPVTAKFLQECLHRIRRHFGDTRQVINLLLNNGQLQQESIEGIAYYWPSNNAQNFTNQATVRFLAPFDPIVRDRLRFEHLWGWQYRFEAYTPKSKRLRGYYAMPLLWRSEIIGWANIHRRSQAMEVEVGFIGGRPASNEFQTELEHEIQRMKQFLGL